MRTLRKNGSAKPPKEWVGPGAGLPSTCPYLPLPLQPTEVSTAHAHNKVCRFLFPPWRRERHVSPFARGQVNQAALFPGPPYPQATARTFRSAMCHPAQRRDPRDRAASTLPDISLTSPLEACYEPLANVPVWLGQAGARRFGCPRLAA